MGKLRNAGVHVLYNDIPPAGAPFFGNLTTARGRFKNDHLGRNVAAAATGAGAHDMSATTSWSNNETRAEAYSNDDMISVWRELTPDSDANADVSWPLVASPRATSTGPLHPMS